MTPTGDNLPGTAGSGAVAALLVLFLCVMLAVIAADGRQGGDEALYTDAALQMVKSGDFITPRSPEGDLRFQKPALAYWLIAGSWKAFGVSYFSARLPFALIMTGVVLVTGLLAHALFGRGAVAAAAVMMSNYTVFYAAERAIPDGALTLFMALALLGFARLLFDPRIPDAAPVAARHRALAWTASGLAVASKGLLGFLLPLYSLGFSLLRRRLTGSPGRPLIGPLSVAAGLCLAAGWFVLATLRHGDAALQGFFVDQVGSRLGSDAGVMLMTFLGNFPAYLWLVVRDCLPWMLLVALLVLAEHERWRSFMVMHREACLFVGGWVLLLLVIFAFGNIVRPRYMLPAYPLLAATIGALLTELASGERARRVLAALANPARLLSLVPGLVLLGLGLRIDRGLAAWGLAWIAGTLVMWWVGRRPWPGPATAIGCCILLGLGIYDGVVRPFFNASPAAGITSMLAQDGLEGSRIVSVGVPARVLSSLHVHSGGRVWPMPVADSATPSEILKDAPVVLLGPQAVDAYAQAGWRVQPAGYEYRSFRARVLRELLTADDQEAVFERQRVHYYIAQAPAP